MTAYGKSFYFSFQWVEVVSSSASVHKNPLLAADSCDPGVTPARFPRQTRDPNMSKESARRITSDLHCQRAEALNGKRVEYPVEGSPGLSLRVTPDGIKTWALRYRRQADAKQRRLVIGTYPAVTLKDARERARNARNAVYDGGDPASAKQTRREAATLAELISLWADRKAEQGRAANYVVNQTGRLNRLPKWLREMKAGEIERIHLTRALNDAAKRGKSECNMAHSGLTGVLRWALSEGLINHDPTAGLKKRFAPTVRDRVLNDGELQLYWKAIDKLPASDRAKLALRLILVTGQRPKEICGLAVDDLALDDLHPALTIRAESAKNGCEHIVPLPPLAVSLCRRALEVAGDSKWLFPSPGGKAAMDPHALSRIFVRARGEDGCLHGLADFNVYDSRRSMATYLGDQGHPNEFIALILNHRSTHTGTVTGRHYNHSAYLAQKRTLLGEWNAHLEDLFGEQDAPSNLVSIVGRSTA